MKVDPRYNIDDLSFSIFDFKQNILHVEKILNQIFTEISKYFFHSPLRKSSIIENNVDASITSLRSLATKLDLKENCFDRPHVNEFFNLSKFYEFNENFSTKFYTNFAQINNRLATELEESQLHFLMDLITFTCLTPSRIQFQNNHIERHSLEIFSPACLEYIIQELSQQKTLDLSQLSFFDHINFIEYKKAPLAKKIIIANLSNIDSDMKKIIMTDKFYAQFLESFEKKGEQEAFDWMFACSGALEQNYLNTCAPTSVCQDIISRVCIIPFAILLTEKTLMQIAEKNLVAENDESMYLISRINREMESLKNLKKKILSSINSDLSFSKKHQFTQEWSKIMQRIGLLADSEEIAHPTKKPFSSWLLSALLMIIPALYEHFISYSIPSLHMRLRGSVPKEVLPKDLVYKKIFYKLPLLSSGNLKAYTNKIKASKNYEKNQTFIFWSHINSRGGVYLENGQHVIYIKAVCLNGKKLFLIGDPLIKSYTVKTMKSFHKYIKNSSYQISSD